MVLLARLLAACCAPFGGPTPPPEPPLPALDAAAAAPAPPHAGPVIDLAVPLDPVQLADRLVRAERSVRDRSVDDATAGAWGHLQQRIYRTLADDSVLAGAVMSHIPSDLDIPVRRQLAGTRQIARTVVRPKTDLPNWEIVPAKPAAELMGYYREAGAKYDVPWTVLASIHLNETRMGRLRGASDVGALGPMQFMPETWEQYGEGGDVQDDRDAIFGAARYVDAMGWHTDQRKAIWAYNHSDAYVDAILAFASVMDADERAYRGLWGWQVYYRTVQGSIWLEEGYAQAERISIDTYCGPKGEPYCPRLHDPPPAP